MTGRLEKGEHKLRLEKWDEGGLEKETALGEECSYILLLWKVRRRVLVVFEWRRGGTETRATEMSSGKTEKSRKNKTECRVVAKTISLRDEKHYSQDTIISGYATNLCRIQKYTRTSYMTWGILPSALWGLTDRYWDTWPVDAVKARPHSCKQTRPLMSSHKPLRNLKYHLLHDSISIGLSTYWSLKWL